MFPLRTCLRSPLGARGGCPALPEVARRERGFHKDTCAPREKIVNRFQGPSGACGARSCLTGLKCTGSMCFCGLLFVGVRFDHPSLRSTQGSRRSPQGGEGARPGKGGKGVAPRIDRAPARSAANIKPAVTRKGGAGSNPPRLPDKPATGVNHLSHQPYGAES
jgi:hypothetical protein